MYRDSQESKKIHKKSFSWNSITSNFQPIMLINVKRRPNGNPFEPKENSAPALCPGHSAPGLYSRGSECLFGTWEYHAVPILCPWASPQQWPTWENRPGGGINQLPPPPPPLKSGWTPAGAPRRFGPEPSWARSPWEPDGIPSYILLGNLTWWPPWDNNEGGTFKLGPAGWKKF